MHDTAYEHGRLFFELYGSDAFRTVVELGSQDVNGSLRDHSPAGVHYIGVDVMPAKGVDLVVHPGAPLPLAFEIADAVVTSSAFEHDVCFWNTFLDLLRILRPGGLLYVNVPSNGDFHRYPLDCWRFYPDAGAALVQWAARCGIEVELVESFIAQPKVERWADFVAVFRKAGGKPLVRKGRIAGLAAAFNIRDIDMAADAPLQAESDTMPDTRIALDLRAELVASARHNAVVSADLAAAAKRIDALSVQLADAEQSGAALYQDLAASSEDLAASRAESYALQQNLLGSQMRIAELECGIAAVRQQLEMMRTSASWRITAGLRWLTIAVRGH